MLKSLRKIIDRNYTSSIFAEHSGYEAQDQSQKEKWGKNKYMETKQHATEEAPLKDHITEEIRKHLETKAMRTQAQETCGAQRNSPNREFHSGTGLLKKLETLKQLQRINKAKVSRRKGIKSSERKHLKRTMSEVAQLCPTLCNPMDYSLSGSSVHGIFQARVLEWIAIFLLQGIFPTQESNPGLPHCRQTLCRLSHQGSPKWGEGGKQ